MDLVVRRSVRTFRRLLGTHLGQVWSQEGCNGHYATWLPLGLSHVSGGGQGLHQQRLGHLDP